VLILLAPVAFASHTVYKDPHLGFQIRLPTRNWSQTPLQPGEHVEVAKFKDDRQGDFSTLDIYRFEVPTEGVTTPTAEHAGGPTERPPTRMPPGYGPPRRAKAYVA